MTDIRQETPPDDVIEAAVTASLRSGCSKSKRGCAAFSASESPSIQRFIVTGSNSQPAFFGCSGSEACRRDCGKLCVHAEERVIYRWIMARGAFGCGSVRIVHVKTVDGILVPSGDPSCWVCSRMLVEHGFAGIYLYRQPVDRTAFPGWFYYPSIPFHAETLRNLSLGDFA